MVIADTILAALAAEAYSDDPAPLSGWHLVHVRDDDTDTDALFARSPTGEIVLAIRGTDSAADCWRHAHVWPRAFAGDAGGIPGRVHPAWAASANALYRLAVGNVQDPALCSALYIVGHSLGGAVAQPLATMLYRHAPTVHVVTWGAPPAGNRRFGDYLDAVVDSQARYVKQSRIFGLRVPDKVTRWATLYAMGYRHPCPATRLPSPTWWPYDDHSMAGYVAAMEGVTQ